MPRLFIDIFLGRNLLVEDLFTAYEVPFECRIPSLPFSFVRLWSFSIFLVGAALAVRCCSFFMHVSCNVCLINLVDLTSSLFFSFSFM